MKNSYLKKAFLSSFILAAFCKLPAQTTGYSGTGANIDVKYHRMDWYVDPDATKNISGTVTTYFKTVVNNVSTINFDFTKASFNNGSLVVKYHGTTVTKSFPSSGNVNILNITLPVSLPINTLDSVSITYSGAPPAFSTYGEGFDKASIAGNNTSFTLAESYGDDDFWPCKADMKDKIDSIDYIITTPSAFTAATNGLLISNTISGANRIMVYKHRYPIASYLVAISVAKYNIFNRGTVNINGTNVPVDYYIYTGRGANPTTQLNAMDFCKQELVAFSNVYGDYPFKNEKYGMYEFGWGGGMEHQTFSAMGWSTMSSWSVIAHELAHQWFGDKVTTATWNHLWLNEGFAQYSEILAAELVTSMGKNPVTHRGSIKTTALATSTTPIYLSNADIANSNLIWTTANDNAIYKRGAMVVSMLRKLAGDTKFFQALQNYLADPALAYRSATTDDMKNHFEAVLGYDLDAFFNDFIYGTGNPVYTIKWGNNGTRVNIQVASQSKSSGSSVSYFDAPVVVTMSNGVKDTTVVIYDQQTVLSYAGNGISAPYTRNVMAYDLSFAPTTVTYDQFDETLSTGSATKDNTLNNVIYSVLPIDIINYTATPKEGYNLLTLKIATSEDKPVVTQERSENGTDFISLGNMVQTNSAAGEVSYQFIDRDIIPSQNYYYRAKTQDNTSIVKYSKTIRVASVKPSSLSISPNPAGKQVLISWEKNTTGAVEVKLTNLSGQLIYSNKTNEDFLMINTATLLPGTYLVQVIENNIELLSSKLLIQH